MTDHRDTFLGRDDVNDIVGKGRHAVRAASAGEVDAHNAAMAEMGGKR